MLEDFYSTREVAEILGVTTKAIEKWRLEGKLRPVKAGKLCRYPESEINRFLGISDDRSRSWANENIDEDGNARGELAAARKLSDAGEVSEATEVAKAA